jgi:hypothetical protein
MRRLVVVCFLCCSTALAQAEERPAQTSARDYLHFFWNYPKSADAHYGGKQAVVAGLVDRVRVDPVRGQVLELQTNERSYVIRCWLAGEQDLSGLVHGQVVEVIGRGVAAPKHSPDLEQCSVSWRGEMQDRPSDLLVTISSELCAAQGNLRELEARVHGAQEPRIVAIRKDYVGQIASDSALLSSVGAVPLACDYPLIPVIKRCLEERLFDGLSGVQLTVERGQLFVGEPKSAAERNLGSECVAPEVKLAVEHVLQYWKQRE